MKSLMILIALLLPIPIYAACKCNCAIDDRTLCASAYDLDHPCNGMCANQVGRTACPVVHVYDQTKRRHVWLSLCTETPYSQEEPH